MADATPVCLGSLARVRAVTLHTVLILLVLLPVGWHAGATGQVRPPAAQSAPALAATTPAPRQPGEGLAAARPLWEFGLGAVLVRQLAYPGSDVRVSRRLAVPYFLYRGKVLRAENGSFGVRAVRRPRYELDLGFAAAFGSGSSVPVRDGMPAIGSLGEVGPRLRIRLGALDRPTRWQVLLPLRAVVDLSDQLSYRGLAFEPRLVYSRLLAPGWRLSASLGAVFGDRRLTSTFYGVDAGFATPTRPAYDARSGLITTRVGVAITHRLNRHLSLRVFVRGDSVAGAANRNSPLVQRETGYTAGIGLGWTIRTSTRPAYR